MKKRLEESINMENKRKTLQPSFQPRKLFHSSFERHLKDYQHIFNDSRAYNFTAFFLITFTIFETDKSIFITKPS